MGILARLLVLALVIAVSGCEVRRNRGGTAGSPCTAPEQCARGLTCASDGVCRAEGEPGTAGLGTSCVASSQCRIDLVCASDGRCARPGEPGTAGFDEPCDDTDDCVSGLTCHDGLCKGLELPLWLGTRCEDEEGPFRVLFELPPEGQPRRDFYRLPFPNDVRVDAGGTRIDLSGHPTPGALIPLLGDVVGDLTRVVETELGGRFGPNQAVFFRFSEFPDSSTIRFGLPGQGTLALVDVTPGAEADAIHPMGYTLDSGRTPYICPNWLAVHPVDGRALEPGHTYAVILTRGIRGRGGEEPEQEPNFATVVGRTEPLDARLARAWRAYAPLRSWLELRGVDRGSLAAATVFTVQDPLARAAAVYDAVQAAAAPVLDELVRCGDGADPFADAADPRRGCSSPSAVFHELQAVASLPRFQDGTPPFKEAVDGGGIEIARGLATIRGLERVHVTFTVPKGAEMPEAGWPVVLYAHGTDGAYTSVVRDGFAGHHTRIDLDDGPVHLAMIGFDLPLHGPRANPSEFRQRWLEVDPGAYEPDVLFFNPLNPRAARDNALQQAADAWALVRLLAELDLDADESPLGEPLRFDLENLSYVGHSQGALTGPLFAALEAEVRALVLSGGGALTIRSLLEKQSPDPLLPSIRVGLADPQVTRVHPVLNLAQAVAEGVDGANFARHLLRRPLDGHEGKHVLQLFGVGDTYTPDSTQHVLARAAYLQQVTNGQPPLDGVATADALPLTGGNTGGTTGVVVLHAPPAGRDGHFVLFDVADARRQVGGFLGTAVRDGVPTVPAP